MSNGDIEQIDNYIIETAKRIDRIQKEIIMDSATSCLGCETSLITRANNTIPVTLYTNSGPFSAIAELPETFTSFFRIECIRDNRHATLRLLSHDGTTLTATNRTAIFDLEACIGIQCHEAIDAPDC